MNQKGFANIILVVVIVAVVAGVGGYFVLNRQAPSIFQLSPFSGPVGTMVIINGKGFTYKGGGKGEKAENEVYMEMSKNYTGYIGSFDASSDGKELRFTIPSGAGSCSPGKKICTKEIIGISLGDRKIYVKNTRGLSNAVVFTVTTAPAR